MKYREVKFTLDYDDYDYSIINDVFNRNKSVLNWLFDENLNVKQIDKDIDYQVKDISNLERKDIEELEKSFFSFAFDSITDAPLYRFLVLKNNNKLTILTNINSLIFDYTSANDLYELFSNTDKIIPPYDLDSHYSDVNDYLNSSDFEMDSNYWRDYILNASDHIKFYNLKNNNCKSQKINADNNSVLAFIENHGCSLFDFYASVFSLYMSRIDRLDGCLLKTVIPGKKSDLGLFDINTLLNIDVNNNDSFHDLLSGFSSSFEEVIEHTKVDVDNYLDENVSYYSVYDFSDLNENITIVNGDDCALTLNIHKDSLELVYNSEVFSDIYVDHMAKNIESLIDNVLSSPNQTICNIDIISDEEKDLISNYCKGKSIEVEEDKMLCQSFREHAHAKPDILAVDDGVNQVTYGELEKSSNSLANDLYENYNIAPGSRVGLMLPRNYHFPEMVLALNKIGAAYVPIDLLFPLNRIGHMLTIAQAEHIITTRDIAQKLDLNANIICIEDLNDTDDVDMEILAEKDDLFAIIFTSGTTGIPKGVMFHNRQYPWAGAALIDMFNFHPGDVVGSYFSFSFVASLLINASLYMGGSVRLFNEEEQKNSLLLIKALKETHLNSLILPPSVGIPIFENEDLNLDYLVLAGAKLNELSKKDRHTKLVNFYGTTEVIFAISKIYDLKDIEDDHVPIGKPVANTWAYILDENKNPMPVGVPGEICISGGIMSGGYCNDPELMAEVFVENPFSDSELNRIMYRTGDIGFYNYDGEIEIIGREDNQLSVRGFRIESNEILTIMKSFTEISDIYLDVDNDNLIAYYTTNDELDINEVKEDLKNELPYYMIPSLFIELEEIPLNINGKIDKSKLRTLMNTEDIEIADEVISCVVDAFKEVLNLDHVMIDDDFVSLGGNSLSAMKLQMILKEKLGVSLSSNEIMELSTPNDIGNHIKYNLNVHSEIDENRYTFDEPCPLSESQLNVYLDESVNDMGTAYNNPFKIDFNNPYQAYKIRHALIKLFEVFPILKARVLDNNGELSFTFDGNPEINEGSVNDIPSFVKPFETDRYLSRFLIAENGDAVSLCADFHHLIFDGTSLNILLDKFISILNGEDVEFVDNGALREISFEETIDSGYMDEAHEFFDGMLADKDEVHELMACINGDDSEFEFIDTFDMDIEYLSSFLKNNSITYNQFFTSVFAYTLSRFSGSDKVLFNIIEDGRGHIDLSESMGMFVKTLPVLMDCQNQDIDSYLEYSSNLINSVMKYDLYPFRLLANEYDLNSNILFQYSHDLFSDVVNRKDLKYSIDEMEHDLNADLTFFILNNGKNKLTIRILYSSIYSKSFIERFVESYKLILHGMIESDRLQDINYISSTDIDILDSYNQTQHDFKYNDILDAFNDNLEKYENNILVGYKDSSYTHGQGAYISNEIASRLSSLGVAKQDYVSLFVNRSEWFLLASMGVLSMGGIYVPIDTTYPDERIILMLEDTESKAVIVDNDSKQRMQDIILENDLNIDILNASDITAENISTSNHLNAVEIDENDVACVLYTSGTTGTPKGVLVTRKAVNNFVSWYVNETGFTSDDVYGMHCSYVFDMHTHALYSSVITGGALYVVPEEIRLDLKVLNDYFVEYGCTHTYITSQVGKLFAESGMETTIKLICFGGMKLGELNAPDSIGPFESYGPSENLAISTSIFANKRTHHSSIGRFISNVKGYVLDNEHRRVPLGAVGELYLAGPQLTKGYLNRQEENAKAFLENPFDDEESHNRIYATGDLVRFLPDGTLGIVGRRDSQVKIRGNRVELTEVESAIRSMDDIEDVTVQVISNNGNNELVAYIVTSKDLEGNDLTDYVRQHVSSRKPEYMIPSYVMKLDNIPLNVNGKVNKRALPDVDVGSLHAEYVAPSTDDEKIIVEAFEKVFNQKIGIHDDFVRLGGDSLTAIKLLSYLEGYNITAVDILSLHTPYAIAKNIKKVEFDWDIYTLESGCPLNESQLNVYLDIIVNSKDDAYIIPLFMELSKKYDVNEIQDALYELFAVHPILSMRISDEYEVPYLVKGAEPQIIVENDVSDDFMINFLNEPFDLQDSLCRFLIVDDNDNYRLIAAFNHIIFDALSSNAFKHTLQSILDGETIDMDDSFLKASAFSQQIQGTADYDNAKNFYESMLSDNEESSALLESIDATEQGKVKIDLDLDGKMLKSFLEKYGVSENILFTSSFAYTLSRFTASEYASFNLVENGRDRFNNFDSIGMYVNTLPILVNCKNQDIASFMEHTARLIYDVMKYNYYPFRLLANEYNITSDILFQYLPKWIGNDETNENGFQNSKESDIIAQRDNMISDFNVEVAQRDNNYELSIMYSDRYSRGFVENFAKSYRMILQQITAVEKLDEINYITGSDIEILESLNQTQHDFKYTDILDAFNDNLEKYENNILVGYKDTSYTHGQGAYISNEIADRLSDLAVAKQDYVSLFVNRSEWFLLASMGVLSMGGIYVPIDTTYPDERIILMLEDTNAKAVIVDNDSKQRMQDIILENDLNIDILNASDITAENISTSNHLNAVEIDENDVACVLYTSGTTGTPKGVLVTRKAVNNFVSWYVNETGFTSDDVYGMHCSYVFDMHTHALYSSVITGGALYVVPEEIRLDLKALNDYFVEYGCTHTYITSQVGKLFAESGMETTIKLICFGGMKLGKLNAPDSIGPFESYGPSENLAISTSIFANKRTHHSSIGRFISNVKGYVLDNEHRRVPLGAVGELYLAGPQLTKGYLNRQEENAKAFLENPFDDEESHNRIYATGDLVRFLPDCTLGIVGRRDSQVKIRGNRVELTEVESAIRSMDDIEDVTVQVISNNGNNELVAYIVTSKDLEGNDLTDYVRQHVSSRKPEYMVPSYVVKLDAIPLNVNGKVNKSALPDVDVSSLHAEYVAPTNEIESQIIDAFEQVFNQNGIGLNDDFVRLGGDSITAIRVISLLEENGITCSARDILNYKTPSLIAQNIENVESISYDAVEGAVNLLPIQEFFFDQINRDNFSQHFILKSNEKLEKDILQDAFNELCNVHDMLRVKFSSGENGDAIQEIMPLNTKICEISEYNISGNLEESLKDIFIKSTNSLKVDGNLIEINLIHHEDESYLMFIIHHLIIDGVSWNILISDLTSIYSNLKAGKEAELSRPYPYKNWVDDVKDLVNNISEDEKQHWMKINSLLDDSAIKGNANPFRFDVDLSYDVNNILMLSEEEYWALAIARAYKKTYGNDIIFNRETHGRDESIAKLNRTIGWFTSQYPILVNANNKYDDISLMNDVYNVKAAFKETKNMGLNYSSMIYTTNDLAFKHCPVTFNFLSSEFMFKNELFESIILDSSVDYEEMNINSESPSYGITFNVVHNGNLYDISGEYAENTYLGDEFDAFIENIKYELEFIGSFNFKNGNIVCCLSESQLGIYLDEKVHEKDAAYSTPGIFEYDSTYSINDIEDAIHTLINKHPILKGRVLDTDNIPFLICDSYPSIEIVDTQDYANLIRPFDLDKSLARFFIVDDKDKKSVFYDMHHIISDATSRTIINKELSQALAGKLDDATDLGFVYASRDSFESQYSQKYESAHEFFINEFGDIDDVQHMLSDIDGKMGSVSLPIRGIREKMESFTQENGITVGNLLNAAFAYTYSRFAGSDKVHYNFTGHGRHENYLQDALGMYVQTIPAIVDCENKSVKEFVTDTSDLILSSMANSIYPFRLLAREFDLGNDVLFEYNFDLADFDIGDDIVVRDTADSISEFLCVVNDLEDGFVVSVSHSDKFSQNTAIRFVKAFKEILTQFLEKEKLADITYISNDDIELLDACNQTDYPLAYDDILDAFNDNLTKYPENKLVEYGDDCYSFAESAYIADAVGKKLSELGVKANDCVSFLVPRSELYIFCILGIMSVGCTYIPLNDKLPDERIEFMINDTESKVVIVSDETYQRGDSLTADAAILNISEIMKEEIGTLSSLPVIANHLLCILYTSGTTGLPKGVKVTRKAIANFTNFNVNNLKIQPGDVYGLFTSISFDVAMAAIFSSIYSGACINVIPEDIKLNINALNSHFIKYGVAYTDLTTQIAKLFVSQIEKTSLKVLLAIGEKLGQIDETRDYQIVDAYGPTEACVSVTRIDVADKIDYSSVGNTYYNTKAYVLDSELRQVPIGATGELYLSGRQLADGYLNREEETSKAFIANPFENNEEYGTIYRTGDVARVLPDGTYGIIGRRDSQVKIRGNRLELTEVESTIREIDYVDDATVQTIKHDTNNELVAYVVVGNELDGDDLTDSICDYVKEHKPDYMVPSYVIRMDAIPLNVNGKVDKKALPEVDRANLHAEYVAPRNKNEKKIVEAFEKALNLERVSIHDDFIRLGGDSLTAIKLLSYIDSNEVTMVDILTFRTPEAIAKNMPDFSFDLDLYSLESGSPLNGAQLNVFADVIIYNKRNAYHIPGYIVVPKEYSLEKILESLDKLLDAHPILSMKVSDKYEVNDEDGISNMDLLKDLMLIGKKFGMGKLMDIIKSYGLRDVGGLYNMMKITIRLLKGEYPYLVKGSKPSISVQSEFDKKAIIDFFAENLDIFTSMAKFMVVESKESYYLLYNIHHMIFDAISAGVFQHDFQTLLDGGSVGLDDTFLKASALTQQIKATEKFNEASEYYNPILSDIDDVGMLLKDNDSEGYNMSFYDLNFDMAAFKSFLKNAEISENVLFTSVFSYALSQLVNGDKVIFTMIENGRDRFNENFIGMTSNVMPLVADCRDQSIDSFMKHMSDNVYGALKHSYYPILLLYQKYNFEVNILFQVVPNWIADDFTEIDDNEANEIFNQVLNSYSDYLTEFFVQIYQNGEDYKLVITHTKKYSESMVNEFKDAYMTILSNIINSDMSCDLSSTLK